MAYDKNPDGSYVDLEYTKFPAEVDSWQNNEDITAEYLSLANDYKSAILAGNYENARKILDANPQLKRMMITADDINKIKHSTMALERLFTEDIETYVKSFTDKATSEAEKATSSATSAALSEKNSEGIKSDVEDIRDTIQKNIDVATTLSNEAKTSATDAKASADKAQESLNYLQGYVGGYYNSYLIDIPSNNWVQCTSGAANYECTVACDGAADDRIPMASILPESVQTSMDAWMIPSCSSGDKTITFYSNKKPASIIKTQVTLFSKTA